MQKRWKKTRSESIKPKKKKPELSYNRKKSSVSRGNRTKQYITRPTKK